MNFKDWLSEYENVDRPIGDLAKEVGQDETFPSSSDYEILFDYLDSRNAQQAVLDTFEYVYRFYKDDTRP